MSDSVRRGERRLRLPRFSGSPNVGHDPQIERASFSLLLSPLLDTADGGFGAYSRLYFCLAFFSLRVSLIADAFEARVFVPLMRFVFFGIETDERVDTRR